MDLDRLKALIRLANNNPSEHEANAAARRVCLELAKDNFALLNRPRTAADKLNQHRQNYGGMGSEDIFQDLYDIMRKARQYPPEPPNSQKSTGTWTGFDRSKEPEFKSTPPKDPREQETWKGGFKPNAAQEEFFKNAHRVHVNDDFDWVGRTSTRNSNFEYGPDGKRIKRSAKRKCSQCGLEVDTYRLREEPFVCNPCHWKEKL